MVIYVYIGIILVNRKVIYVGQSINMKRGKQENLKLVGSQLPQ